MLIAVVPQALVPIVVLFMFMLAIPSVLPTGVLAQPYHLNQLVIIFIKLELMLIIILFAAVAQGTMPSVGLSILLLIMLPLLSPGLLAQPYHLNHTSDYFYQNRNGTRYSDRGGNSRSGAFCGAFSVFAYVAFSVADWDLGAAISFKPYK